MSTEGVDRPTPILHLLRHGQGFHALSPDGQNLRDPELTPRGREQCAERRQVFNRHDQVDALFASPLRRTMQTCQLVFQPCIERGLRVVAVPNAVEAFDDAADTGTAKSDLVVEFPDIDFHLVEQDWYRHEGDLAADPATVFRRAKNLRVWLRDQPAKEIVLVAHGMFNHYLLGEVDEAGTQTTPWWKETEWRSYTFSSFDDPAATLHETSESLNRREADDTAKG